MFTITWGGFKVVVLKGLERVKGDQGALRLTGPPVELRLRMPNGMKLDRTKGQLVIKVSWLGPSSAKEDYMCVKDNTMMAYEDWTVRGDKSAATMLNEAINRAMRDGVKASLSFLFEFPAVMQEGRLTIGPSFLLLPKKK